VELETSEAKNTAPCQEMRQPAGRALGGTETFLGTGMLCVSPRVRHPCLFPSSPHRAMPDTSARSGRGEGVGSPGFAVGSPGFAVGAAP